MSSHVLEASATIRAPASSALALVHDPVRLSRFNPLSIDVTQSPTHPNIYNITDQIPVLGGLFNYMTRHTAIFTPTDDGVNVDVLAQSFAGTMRMKTRWKVMARDDESCDVTETVLTLEANRLVTPYILYELRKSHGVLLQSMKEQLEGQKEIIRRSIGDPYGDFHLTFNSPAEADPEMRPETEWVNMGYWRETQSFPQACEALALELVDAAKCISGGHVLDVGHACGDSLLLHLSHPKVPRPASLTGITKLSAHHVRSLERITRKQTLDPHACNIVLFCGDAVFKSGEINHPLDPSSSAPPFSTILALDCAYHFSSRELFLRQSFVRLSPGGTVALADLAVSSPLSSGLRAMLSTLFFVPSENMVTPQIYEAQLKAIGYVDIHITDISKDVFPGFRAFLTSRGGLWRLFELVVAWWANAGGLFLIVSASKPISSTEQNPHPS